MDFFEVVIRNKRFKEFKAGQLLTSDQIKQLMACAQLAPSLSEIQNFTYIIIDDQVSKEKLAESGKGLEWIANAAAIFAVVVVSDDEDVDDTNIIDAIIASSQLMMAATATHLGCSLVVDFDSEIIGSLVGITSELSNLSVIALIPIGETVDKGSQGYKRTLAELSNYNRLGQPYPYD
jgi:nitroreductase